MNLTDQQLDRYARHIVLREIGGAGQTRLLQATVAVVGAGGIGSPALQYLAAAGVGRLIVIDDDRVELSNLQRQTLFDTAAVGLPKAAAAQRAIRRLNPDVAVEPRVVRIDAANAGPLIAGSDVVLDGCDNFATRFAVADAALAARIPLVSAAVGQFEGQLAVFRGWEADKPCYRCFVGDAFDTDDCDTCAEQGVLGALTAMVGSFAALMAIRAIAGIGDDVAGSLFLFDGVKLDWRKIRLPKDPNCRTCSA